MRFRIFIIVFFAISFIVIVRSHAQIRVGQDTIYGNEWLKNDQDYIKIKLADTKIYRLTGSDLEEAGLPLGSIRGEDFSLYRYGAEEPIYVSEPGVFTSDDFIEFAGERNGTLPDTYLFEEGKDGLLNPHYSLFSDSSAYFLSWKKDAGQQLRYAISENEVTGNEEIINSFRHMQVVSYNNQFSKQNYRGQTVSHFNRHTGFASGLARTTNVILPALQRAAGGMASISVKLITGPRTSSQPEKNLQILLNGVIFIDETVQGNEVLEYTFEVPTSSLSSNNTVRIHGAGSSADRYQIAFVSLTYDRQFSFKDDKVNHWIEQTFSTNAEIRIITGDEIQRIVILDRLNKKRSILTKEGSYFPLRLGNTERTELFTEDENTISKPDYLKRISIRELVSPNADYVIVSHPYFISGPGAQALQAYIAYRSSSEGGGFTIEVVNILEIYNQFAFGIDNHDLALRSFVNYAVKNSANLKFLNIIGKGIQFTELRSDQNYEAYKHLNFVSSYGSPASDNIIGSRAFHTDMIINIGRLPVTEPGELLAYLDKLKKQEALINSLPEDIEKRIQLKRIVHLSGGDVNIQASLRNYMDNLGITISETTLGALVESYYKRSGEVVGQGIDRVYQLINEGAFMVTFFGHSSTATFDLNIGNLNEYTNTEMFPIMLALGCYSGNYHVPFSTIGENLTFAPGRAFIANIASAGLSSPSELNFFTREFYKNMGNNRESHFVREKMNMVLNQLGSSNTKISQYMNFIGDPALKHYIPEGPDLSFRFSETNFNPPVITTDADTVELSLKVINLGSNQGGQTDLNLERILPSGETVPIFDKEITVPAFDKEIKIKFPVAVGNFIGRNMIRATLNNSRNLEEWPANIAYNNNNLTNNFGENGFPFFVFGFNVEPVFPADFSIVPEEKVTLTASVFSPQIKEEDFIVFELDSTPDFNSSLKTRERVPFLPGILPSWTPGLALEEDKVYFWRVSQDSINIERPYNWKASSFTHIPGQTGWNQSHWAQFAQDSLNLLVIDEDKKFDFASLEINIDLKISSYSPAAESDGPSLIFNNGNIAQSMRPWTNRSSGIYVMTRKKRELTFWVNAAQGGGAGLYGSRYTNTRDLACFPYDLSSEASRDSLINFLDNIIPDDNYIYIATIRNTPQDSIDTELLTSKGSSGKSFVDVLKEQGAQLVEEFAMNGTAHYGFIYEKNRGKVLDEGISLEFTDPLYMNMVYLEYVPSGILKTTPIGPAKTWQHANWEHEPLPSGGSKKVLMKLSGKEDTSQEFTELTEQLNESNYGIDISGTNYESLNQLRFSYNPMDTLTRTVVQLKKLRVLFEPLPDLVVYSPQITKKLKDTIQSGQEIRFPVHLKVLVDGTFKDTVECRIRLSDNTGIRFEEIKQISLMGDEEVIEEIEITSAPYKGNLTLEIAVNPNRKITETNYLNNFLTRQILVRGDNINPVMNLTFDGQRILNGDLVATNPQVLIVAKDDNAFKLLDNPELFNLRLKRPGQDNFENLEIIGPEFKFVPAADPSNNEARIEWTPLFATSGDYELSVNTRDSESNSAGKNDMQIFFKVITENSISNLVNYPNPFTDRTKFVYTLTGANVPYDYKIEIYTVSGKLIREIRKEELGPLRVGSNMTDYEWNARDTFGNRLANGVYLYRMVIRDQNSDQVKHYDTKLDRFAKNNFSKMVIIK